MQNYENKAFIIFKSSEYNDLIWDLAKSDLRNVIDRNSQYCYGVVSLVVANYVGFLLGLDTTLKEYAEQENIEIDTTKIHMVILSIADDKLNICNLKEFAAGDCSMAYPLMYFIIDSLLNDKCRWEQIADAVNNII